MRSSGRLRGLAPVALSTALLVGCSSPNHSASGKEVDFEGVRVLVPSSWPVQSRAGLGVACISEVLPPQPVVIVDSTPVPQDVQVACGVASRSSGLGAVVVISRITPTGNLRAWTEEIASRDRILGGSTVVHGLAGFAVSVTSHSGRYSGAFIAYNSGVAVGVTTTSGSLTRAIVASIRPSP
jgi:hypothetical protein